MTTLAQLLAVEKGVKSRTASAITGLYHLAQKPVLWSGITRTYTRRDDEGDRLPSESTLVQHTATAHLAAAQRELSRLIDVVAAKDAANREAAADVVVDGDIIITAVPATTLLFLEKQLTDLRTFVDSIPILDPASTWDRDQSAGVWTTPPAQTTRSTKVPRNHVKYEATVQHPAQVDVFTEDVIVGTWTTRKLAGGLPSAEKAALLARVDALGDAVKVAREDANRQLVTDVHLARPIFEYLFRQATV